MFDEYDQLIEQAGNPERNEYDDLIGEREKEKAVQRRGALTQAVQTPPDQYAESRRLAKRAGLPADVVERNRDQVSREVQLNEYDQLLRDHSKLGDQMADLEFAKLASDDTEALSGFERYFRNAAASIWNNTGKPFVDFQRSLLTGGAEAVGRTESGLAAINDAFARSVNRGLRGVGADPVAEFLERPVIPSAIDPSTRLRQSGETYKRIARDVLRPEDQGFVGQVGEGLGQLAAQALTAYLTGGAGSVAQLSGQGADIQQERAEAAGTEGTAGADAAVFLGAGVTAVTERYQLDALLGRIPPKIRNRAVQRLADWALAGGGEAVQEVTEGALQDVVTQALVDPSHEMLQGLGEEATVAGTVGLIARALITGALPGRVAGGPEVETALEAARAQMRLEQINRLAAESKLKGRAPEQLQRFLERFDGDNPSELYIDAGRFTELLQTNGIDPADVVSQSPTLAAQYREARATGGDMRIPLAEYAATLAGNDELAVLTPEFRFDPEAMSAAEAEAVLPDLLGQTEADAVTETSPEVADSAAQVREDVLGQLMSAGMEQGTAEAQADLYGTVFRTLGERAGIDPAELYQRYGLTVDRPLPEVLTQITQTDQMDALLDRLRTGDIPSQSDAFGRSLLEFIRERGLIDEGGELAARDIDVGRQPFQRRIVRDDGRTLDDMAELAVEAGYLPERDPNALLDLIDRELGGDPVFAMGAENRQMQELRAVLEELDAYLGQLGVDLSQLDNTQVKALLSGDEVAPGATEEQQTVLDQAKRTIRRGSIRFGKDRQFRIELYKDANLSTFLHESGHFYLEVLGDLAQAKDAPQQIQDDYQAILDWFGVKSRDDIKTDQHEQWARGFEAYLMEGKAPTSELRRAFSRFRAWMIAIYRRLTALNVELTDEVRGVMDRLVATDAELEAVRSEASFQPLFEGAEAAGMDSDAWERYQESVTAARMESEERVTAEAMGEVQREQKRWYREARDAVRAEVEAEVNRQREYVAASVLGRGKLPGGEELPEGVPALKLDKKALADEYGTEFLKKRLPRPYVYAREGGVHPDIAAELLGFDSGDEMVMALADLRPRKQLIEAETEVRMRERYGDIRTDGSATAIAQAAVHNERQAELLLAEVKALASRTKRRAPPVTLIRDHAQRAIAAKRVRDVRPDIYRRAERKAARQAFEAAANQDFAAAFEAKQRQLLNHELYRAARDAREAAEKHQKAMLAFRKKSRREVLGRAGEDYLEQMDGILADYEFARISNRQLDRREGLRAWLARQQQEMDPIKKPDYVEPDARSRDAAQAEERADPMRAKLDELATEASAVNWRELTVEQLAGVRDNAEMIWHLAKLKDGLLASRYQKTLTATAEEVGASVVANANRTVPQSLQPELRWNRAKAGAAEFLAKSRRVPSFAREMDGGQDGGAVSRHIIEPLNRATVDYGERMKAHGDAFAEIWNRHYTPKEQARMLKRPQEYRSIGASITKDAVLAIALNWGNEGNRARLMDGEGWTERQVESVLDTLDRKDWEFAQDVWDYVDSYWPEFRDNHRDLFGIPPEKVKPVEVRTKHGTFRGGYYPVAFDPTRNLQTREREVQQQGQRFRNPSNRTKAGSSISRVQGTVRMPLRLSVASVVNRHVSDTIHHIAFDRTLLDVARLLARDEVKSSMTEHYGRHVYDRFNRLLTDIKWGTKPAEDVFERAVTHARNGTSVAYMGFSVTTALLQPLGLSNSVVQLSGDLGNFHGAYWVLRGLARMGGSAVGMENAARFAMERSGFMRLRRQNTSREVGDVLNRIRGRNWRTKLDEAAFWLITNVQFAAVDLPTWYGAYEKAIASGVPEDQASTLADQVVRDAQGGGDLIDQTEFQRGGPTTKLFTNFMSYMATTYSMQAERYRNTDLRSFGGLMQLASDHLMLAVVPAVGAVLLDSLKEAASGGEDDEDKDFAVSLGQEVASMYLGGFIGFREFSGVVKGFSRYEGPAGLSVFSETTSLAAQIGQGDMDESLTKAGIRAGAIIFHLPSTQVERAVFGSKAMIEGETDSPGALLFGPPRNN